MTTPIEDIQALLKQIKQYGIQISTLTDLQDAATARLSKHIEELDLSSSRLIPIMQTQGTETKRSPLYIWENIGEGG